MLSVSRVLFRLQGLGSRMFSSFCSTSTHTQRHARARVRILIYTLIDVLYQVCGGEDSGQLVRAQTTPETLTNLPAELLTKDMNRWHVLEVLNTCPGVSCCIDRLTPARRAHVVDVKVRIRVESDAHMCSNASGRSLHRFFPTWHPRSNCAISQPRCCVLLQ